MARSLRGIYGPLRGVRILDFTEVLSGPYCTQLLGDLGAEVVKVEPPWGDSTREFGPPFVGKDSAYYQSLNRNKKSIVIDLSETKPRGREIALRLARQCDVVIESFRPGVMRKLGLGYGDIQKINPAAVYCSISGYGQNGSMSQKPGYDISAYAASGIMSITGEEGGRPVKTGIPIADIGTGLCAALAISVSLYEAKRTGKGTYIDVSLYDTMISWLTFQAGYTFATGRNPKKLGSAHPILVPYQAFRARDRYFILAVGNDALWQRACKAIGEENLAGDKRFLTTSSRLKNRRILCDLLERIFQKRNARSWLDVFEESGVPCESIQTVMEALESDHTKDRNLILRLKNRSRKELKSLASPIHFGKHGNKLRRTNRAPPLLGEDTIEVLNEFGFSKEEIIKLLRNSTVATPS